MRDPLSPGILSLMRVGPIWSYGENLLINPTSTERKIVTLVYCDNIMHAQR